MAYEKTNEIALIFDTETTDLPKKQPLDHPSQPYIIQIGLMLAQRIGTSTDYQTILEFGSVIQLPKEAKVSPYAQKVHGISKEFSQFGVPIGQAMDIIDNLIDCSDIQVAHNLAFDRKLLDIQYQRSANIDRDLPNPFCTMLSTIDYCKLPGRFGKYKWPKLGELHQKLFNESFSGAHDALADVRATARCYFTITSEGFEL